MRAWVRLCSPMRPAGGWWFEWCRLVSLFSSSRSFFTLPCDFFSGLYLPRASTAPLPLGCRQTWHSPQFFHFGARPLFLCRCVSFSLLLSFRALKRIPHDNPPQPRPSIDSDPPFEARVVEPTDQTNHSQVSASASASASVRVSASALSLHHPHTSCLACLVWTSPA